jgi:hypothetical protein
MIEGLTGGRSGAAYGIDEGRARERYDQEHPPIALPMLDAEVLKVR